MAALVVFADPLQSRSLHHRATIPSTPKKEPGTQYFRCEAVEKTLRIRQVLKGTLKDGSLLHMETYEIKGVPGIGSQPAIFFLKRDQDAWRPLTDFGPNTIPLPNFPNRPLVSSGFDPGLISASSLSQLLVSGLLDPLNATDWPAFGIMLNHLVSVAQSLAAASGLLSNDPFLIVDKLTALAQAPNRSVAAEARKEIISLTALCQQRGATANDWGPQLARNLFLSGKLENKPGASPQDRARTYWMWKAYSCSTVQEVRLKAERLLQQYFPNQKTVGCEICPPA